MSDFLVRTIWLARAAHLGRFIRARPMHTGYAGILPTVPFAPFKLDVVTTRLALRCAR
jgi:hypothetical protein